MQKIEAPMAMHNPETFRSFFGTKGRHLIQRDYFTPIIQFVYDRSMTHVHPVVHTGLIVHSRKTFRYLASALFSMSGDF
jgi:hypothetical protein